MCYLIGQDVGTSSIDWAYLRTEAECTAYETNRTMDTVQQINNCINIYMCVTKFEIVFIKDTAVFWGVDDELY
jgi:hypothetical protein